MRYFIALMLRGEEKERVDRLRNSLVETFGSKTEPKVPPHVTIVRPFETVASPDIVADAIAELASSQPVQLIDVLGFGLFDGGVSYIDVEQRKRLLDLKRELEARLRQAIAWIPDVFDRDVHFHITLMYQDVLAFLQKQKLPLKKISFDSFSLLQHDGLSWKEIERFPFGE